MKLQALYFFIYHITQHPLLGNHPDLPCKAWSGASVQSYTYNTDQNLVSQYLPMQESFIDFDIMNFLLHGDQLKTSQVVICLWWYYVR